MAKLDMKNRRNKTRTLLVDLDGDTLTVEVKVGRFTPQTLAALAEAQEAALDAMKGAAQEAQTAEVVEFRAESLLQKANGLFDTLAESLAEQVASWDLEDDGIPVPLTREGLVKHNIDIDLLTAVLVAIREKTSPNAPTPTPSTTP